MFAFISLLFDLSHADVDLVTREFRVETSVFGQGSFKSQGTSIKTAGIACFAIPAVFYGSTFEKNFLTLSARFL